MAEAEPKIEPPSPTDDPQAPLMMAEKDKGTGTKENDNSFRTDSSCEEKGTPTEGDKDIKTAELPEQENTEI